MLSNELTEKLISEIRDSSNVYQYIQRFDEDFPEMTLPVYIELIIQKKDLKKSDIIKRSTIHRTYAYKFLSGTRQPSRNTAIQLAYGLSSDLQETQRLLKIANHSPLTPKLKRDAIIIFSIINKLTIQDTNNLLFEHEEALIC